MCRPASMYVMQHRIVLSDDDRHETQLKLAGMEAVSADRAGHPIGVRIEIVPPNDDYRLPLDQWMYCVDQDILPDWYNPAEAEAACRTQLPRWADRHVIGEGTHEIDIGRMVVVLDGTVNVVTGGKCQGVHGGTVNVADGGECLSVHSGTVNVAEGGECQGVHGGTVNVADGGKCLSVHGGTVNVAKDGVCRGVYGGTVNVAAGGWYWDVYGGTVNRK